MTVRELIRLMQMSVMCDVRCLEYSEMFAWTRVIIWEELLWIVIKRVMNFETPLCSVISLAWYPRVLWFIEQKSVKKSQCMCACLIIIASYHNYHKISYTIWSDKKAYANIADPDQTAFEGVFWFYTVCFSTKYFVE